MEKRRDIIIDVICALFVVLFVYAAASKLLDYHKFSVQIGQSPVLTAYASTIAWLVPGLEILIALLMLYLPLRLVALYAAFGMMVMFTTYIIAVTQFSDYVPCSCGGVLEKLSWTSHLIFNVVFVALAVVAILLYPKEEKQNNTAENFT